jgi:rod shape-determining protein MreC
MKKHVVKKRFWFITSFAGLVLTVSLLLIFTNFFGEATDFLQKQFRDFSSFVAGEKKSEPSSFSYKQKYYDLLTREAELEQEIEQLKLTRNEYDELKKLKQIFDNNDLSKKDKVLSANILEYVGGKIFNAFTIDVGSSKGVKVNDAIISGNNLVGRVSSVTKNSARIITTSDTSQKMSFMLENDYSEIGILNGVSINKIEGYFLDENASPTVGNKVLTSGATPLYPKGLEIGMIVKIKKNKQNTLKQVEIKPSVDVKEIQKVGVII